MVDLADSFFSQNINNTNDPQKAFHYVYTKEKAFVKWPVDFVQYNVASCLSDYILWYRRH